MVSEGFKAAVHEAIARALAQADDATVYMLTGWGNAAETVPIYLEEASSAAQAEAGGCPHCTYLGMWSNSWPGYPPAPHGMVWLFEKGIRGMRGDLVDNVYEVLTHELGHALQRDHVLDAMEQARSAGYSVNGYHSTAGCGSCPSRSF